MLSSMMASTEPQVPVRTRATYLIKRLEMAVRSHLDRATSDLGLTTPQYTALSSLRARPGITSAELARMAFITAQAMNEMVGVLERKRFIRRDTSPNNRKELRIFLTDHGQECVQQCDVRADAVERQMFDQLSAEDQQALTRILRHCSDALTRTFAPRGREDD